MASPGPILDNLIGEIGRDETTRERIIVALVAWENVHQVEGVDLRELVTGPIADALHKHVPECTRRLAKGLEVTLPYTSKIGREFAMGHGSLSHVWEPQTTRLLVLLAAGAKNVIIGGAYAGDHAILVASAIKGQSGCVHCFELHPVHVAALKRNVSQNNLTNVVVNECGLWDRPGFVELLGDDSNASPSWINEARSGSFPVTSIDRYAAEAAIGRVDLIMLDIEGGEEAALNGALSQLGEPRGTAPDIVFEIHRSYVDWSQGIKNTSLLRLLYGHGYDVYAVRDFQAHVDLDSYPIELVDLDSIYLEGPPHGFNMFATKRDGRIADLDLKVRQGVSPKLLRHRLSPIHQPGSG